MTARTMGGFDFSSSLRCGVAQHVPVSMPRQRPDLTSLLHRNKVLLRAGQKPPKALKTGTTICGVVFDVRGCTLAARSHRAAMAWHT